MIAMKIIHTKDRNQSYGHLHTSCFVDEHMGEVARIDFLKSKSRVRDMQPAVLRVQITTRCLNKYSRDRNSYSPHIWFDIFMIFLLGIVWNDLAYILKTSPMLNILARRSATSHAALEMAQKSTELFDDRTISTMAPIMVRVLPVPTEKLK